MILCWYSAMISMGWPPSRRPPSWASSSVRPCCGRRKAWFRSTRCIRQKWLNCSLNTSTPFSGRHWNRLRRLLLLWRQRLCPTVVVVVQLSDPLNRPKRNWNDFRHHLPRCCPKCPSSAPSRFWRYAAEQDHRQRRPIGAVTLDPNCAKKSSCPAS